MRLQTRFTARCVIPVNAPPIENGAVLVEDGRIVAVGPDAAVPAPGNAAIIDLGNAALLPGLVNVHAHPELSVLRGALEDLPFHLWIPRLRQLKVAAGFTPEDWRDAARWTCVESVAAGITTMGATEDSDGALHAMLDAGMRGVTFREVFGPAPGAALLSLRDLEHNVAQMRRLATDLVHVGVSPHAPYSVSDDLFRAVARYATKESLPVAVHAAESEAEHLLVSAGSGPFAAGLRTRGIPTPMRGRTTTALLAAAGILDLAPLLIHCVRVDDEDISLIASTGARVAHCPVANARLGHGIAPVVAMREAGVCVGMGSDSVASNNRIDMLEEARIAQIMQRAQLQSASALDATALLRMVTIEGARALGLDDRIGSLEPGKDADLCAVSLEAPHMQPAGDIITALFMSARGTDVVMTAVQGRVLYRSGVHTTIDRDALQLRMDSIGARIRAARDA